MVQTDLDDMVSEILSKQEKSAEKQKNNPKMFAKLRNNISQPPVSASGVSGDGKEPLMEFLANSMTEFIYDPETNQTFEAWYVRYEDLFTEDAKQLDVAAKVRLLMRKLSSTVYTKYADYILPKQPKDIQFSKTVETLKKLFGCSDTLFSMRYRCLHTVKRDCDDITTYAALVNRRCEDFQLGSLTSDQFKCMVFIMGLQSPRDTAVRSRLLNLLHSEKPEHPLTVDSLVDEVQIIGCVNNEHMNTFFENFLKSPTVEMLAICFPTSQTLQTLKAGNYSPGEVAKALDYMKMAKTEDSWQIQDQIAAAFLEGVRLGRRSQTPAPKPIDINTDLTGMLKNMMEKGNELITRSEKYMKSLKPSGCPTKVVYHGQFVINYNSTDLKKQFMVYDTKELCITKYNRACSLFEMILNGLPPAIASSFNTTLMARISEIIDVDKAGLDTINVEELTKVLAIMYREREQS